MSATVYQLPASIVRELPPEFPGTLQPDWQLGYPVRATPSADHGMTNAGATVTTAAAKTGFVVSAAAKHPVSVPASGRIVLPVAGKNWLFIKPIGLGAANVDIPLAVWAWRQLLTNGNNDLDVQEWWPDAIVHTLAKTCAATGIAGGRISDSWKFCDQFVAASTVYRGLNTTGFGTTEHPSAPDDAPAYCYFDIGGAQCIEVEGAKNTLTAWNFLWAMI